MRSPPPARWTIRPNWTPPRKPESVSKVSSSLPVPTRYLPLTVPPNHSKPSSVLLCTCTYSTVVPDPRQARVKLGKEAWRDRGGQYVWNQVVAVPFQKNKKKK